MRTHSDIIRDLGGIRSVARDLGHAWHTTVQGWSDRNRVPVEHWGDLIGLAASKGVSLDTEDFMATYTLERPSPSEQAA